MLAWILGAAVVCAGCGILALSSVLPLAATGQGLLLLGMAIAATVLFGAFEAWDMHERKADEHQTLS